MALDSAAGRADEVAGDAGAESGEWDHSWAEFRDHGLSSDHGLALTYKWLHAFRQIEIGPAAEPDYTKTIARPDSIALAQRAQDATGDQTRDLNHRQLPAVG
jgi:hypothetical protein